MRQQGISGGATHPAWGRYATNGDRASDNDRRSGDGSGFSVRVEEAADSSFSFGVHKADDEREFYPSGDDVVGEIHPDHCPGIYADTEFDWRVGVPNRRPIFDSSPPWLLGIGRYGKQGQEGMRYMCKHCGHRTPISSAPPKVETALRAANLISEGVVWRGPEGGGWALRGGVEVNDNPNIERWL